MALNKKDEFTKIENRIAEFAKALSHPARISILKTLAENNTCICGQIVEVLPLSQSTVSQHLKELKNAGLITGEIEGPASCYSINWKKLLEEFLLLHKLVDNLKEKGKSYNCC